MRENAYDHPRTLWTSKPQSAGVLSGSARPSLIGKTAAIRYAVLLWEEVSWMPKMSEKQKEMSEKQKARIWCVALGALAPTILATAELIRTLVER